MYLFYRLGCCCGWFEVEMSTHLMRLSSAVVRMSLSHYKGALVGAVVGDCMGAPFEGQASVSLTNDVLPYFKQISSSSSEKSGKNMLCKFIAFTLL